MSITAAVVIVSSLLLLAFIVIRRIWLLSVMEEYSITATYYTLKTKQSDEVKNEMREVWPIERIVWDPFRWTLRPYVVHQDHYDAMSEWIVSELAREDLDWTALLDLMTPPDSDADADTGKDNDPSP